MNKEELEQKKQKCVSLAIEICRLRQVISSKECEYRKVDRELYDYFNEREHGQETDVAKDS